MALLRTTIKPSPTTRLSASSSGKHLMLLTVLFQWTVRDPRRHFQQELRGETGARRYEQTQLFFLFELESAAVGIKSLSHLGLSGSAKPLLRQSGA